MAWPEIVIEFTFHAVIPTVIFHAVAALVWPAIRTRSRILRLVMCIFAASLALLALTLLWPAPRPVRAIVAVIALLLAVRIYSYCQSPVRRGFLDYLRFLSFGIPSPFLVYSPNSNPAPKNVSIGRETLRTAASAAIILLTVRIGTWLLSTNAATNSWIINDLIFTAEFAVGMSAFGQFCFGVWQLLGVHSRPIVDNIFASLTPAEFWRRWSWPIHLWLYRYVYLPAGGNPHRMRATLAVFLVSGLQHELLAAIAIGRITGHQTLFFLLNGLGVIVSPAMERVAGRGIIATSLVRLTTLLFLITTASLMFTTFSFIFPIYHKRIWLMWPRTNPRAYPT